VVVYADEVDIDLNPKIGFDWMNRGQQKEVLTPGNNEKRYLAGALNPRTGGLTGVEGRARPVRWSSRCSRRWRRITPTRGRFT